MMQCSIHCKLSIS